MARSDLSSIVVNGIWIVAPASAVLPIPQIVPVECWNLRTWTVVAWQEAGLSAGKINEKLCRARPLVRSTDWLFEAMRVRGKVLDCGLTSHLLPQQFAEIDRICMKLSGWLAEWADE